MLPNSHDLMWVMTRSGAISSHGANCIHLISKTAHDDVIKWKHFPRYWPFVRRIHRSPVTSPHKGQWRGALMFSLICARINGWVNNREAGDLRRHQAHCDVIVMGEALKVFRVSSVKHMSSLFLTLRRVCPWENMSLLVWKWLCTDSATSHYLKQVWLIISYINYWHKYNKIRLVSSARSPRP